MGRHHEHVTPRPMGRRIWAVARETGQEEPFGQRDRDGSLIGGAPRMRAAHLEAPVESNTSVRVPTNLYPRK